MKKIVKCGFCLLISVLFFAPVAMAQLSPGVGPAPDPCQGDPDSGSYDPNNCPLDGGTVLYLLLAAALLLGMYHLYKQKRRPVAYQQSGV